MKLSDTDLQRFRTILYEFYESQGRHNLPWRQPEANGSFDLYKILVSEVMLQQTQVARVIPKYQNFLEQFPNAQSLASAELGQVLREWSGLGYSRRAKYLHQTAAALHESGGMPKSITELVKLPGVGKNTAGAIMAYAYNKPVIFVETNIRTVYIHHFMGSQTSIADSAILDLVEQTLDKSNPRVFYWALMDYGSYLKQTQGNLNKLSKAYTRQSKFEGSLRQLRGKVLRQLGYGPKTMQQLEALMPDSRLPQVLSMLLSEDLIAKHGVKYSL